MVLPCLVGVAQQDMVLVVSVTAAATSGAFDVRDCGVRGFGTRVREGAAMVISVS